MNVRFDTAGGIFFSPSSPDHDDGDGNDDDDDDSSTQGQLSINDAWQHKNSHLSLFFPTANFLFMFYIFDKYTS